jgi:hypothetical protein
MFGWLKKKIVAGEANKIGLFRAFLDWLTAPGNRRIVVGCLIGLAAALRYLGHSAPAEWVDQIKVIVDTLAPGMDAGAFVLLIWSILAAKKKAKENAQ